MAERRMNRDGEDMSKHFKPSGVVTVTTDFGHRGPFVGTMKGVIVSRFPAARIIDLTHEAYVHWPAEAGFWIARSYHYFPAGTVHLAVVDPGVGTDRSVLLAVGDGHAFLAPDNGLLAEVIEKSGATVYHVREQVNVQLAQHALDVRDGKFRIPAIVQVHRQWAEPVGLHEGRDVRAIDAA